MIDRAALARLSPRTRVALVAAVVMVLLGSVAAVQALGSGSGPEPTTDEVAAAAPAPTEPKVVDQYEYVDELVPITVGGTTAPANAPTGQPPTAPAPGGSPNLAPDAATPAPSGAGAATHASAPRGSTAGTTSANRSTPSGASGPTASGPQPSPPAPAPGVTTTTWPPGTEIPSDWPADKPIPPIPAGCVRPHLEDNGVWNCEH